MVGDPFHVALNLLRCLRFPAFFHGLIIQHSHILENVRMLIREGWLIDLLVY